MDLVNPGGICCTSTTGASSSFGRNGITLCNAFGPPVEQASATSLFFPPVALRIIGAFAAGFTAGRTLSAAFCVARTAFNTPRSCLLNASPFASMMFVGFATKSIAPRSMAKMVTSASLLSVSVLTITTFARMPSFCNVSSNCSPSMRGIFTSRTTPS